MDFFKKRISLDMHTVSVQYVMETILGDSGRRIYMNLTDGGKPYRIGEDCYAHIMARKPDGSVIYNACDISHNEIIYDVTNQTLAAAGLVECQLILYGGDGREIASPKFNIRVTNRVYDPDIIESTNEFTALTEALTEVENLDMTMSGKTVTFTDKDGDESTLTFSDKVNGVVTVTFTDAAGDVQSFVIEDGQDGQDGAPGTPGAPGAPGSPGAPGVDGVSVVNVSVNAQSHLIVTLSDGNTFDVGYIPIGAEVYVVDITSGGAGQYDYNAIKNALNAIYESTAISCAVTIKNGGKLIPAAYEKTGNNIIVYATEYLSNSDIHDIYRISYTHNSSVNPGITNSHAIDSDSVTYGNMTVLQMLDYLDDEVSGINSLIGSGVIG